PRRARRGISSRYRSSLLLLDVTQCPRDDGPDPGALGQHEYGHIAGAAAAQHVPVVDPPAAASAAVFAGAAADHALAGVKTSAHTASLSTGAGMPGDDRGRSSPGSIPVLR